MSLDAVLITKAVVVFNATYNCFNAGKPHYLGFQLISSHGGDAFKSWWLFGKVGLVPAVENWQYPSASRFYPIAITVFG